MHLSSLAIYPVKSLRQRPVEAFRLTRFGPEGDRRWMLVDDQGRFLTQRQIARLCLLEAELIPGGLRLRRPDGELRDVAEPQGEGVTVQVWDDRVPALVADAGANDWLSAWLGVSCRLVFMPETVQRPVDAHYAGAGHTVGFADGFPYLLITEASLAALVDGMAAPVPMVRFRPNIVVAGATPFAEDGWRRLRIGEAEFELVKPCSRCAIPSIDPATAQKDNAILTRLREQRRREDGKVYLGQNVIATPASLGAVIRVGDPVTVLA